MEKTWAFDKLVENDSDVEGLIAYGLYKYKKSELAKSLRDQKNSEEEIQTKLSACHQQVVDSVVEQQEFKKNAARVLNAMRENIEAPLLKDFERQLKELEVKHAKQIKKEQADAEKKWISKVKKANVDGKTWFGKFISYVFSGVPSAVATFLGYLVFTIVILVFFSEEDVMKAAFEQFTNDSKKFLRIEE